MMPEQVLAFRRAVIARAYARVGRCPMFCSYIKNGGCPKTKVENAAAPGVMQDNCPYLDEFRSALERPMGPAYHSMRSALSRGGGESKGNPPISPTEAPVEREKDTPESFTAFLEEL